MNSYNILVLASLLLFFTQCGRSEKDEDLFALEIIDKQRTYTPDDAVKVQLNNKKDIGIDSIAYFLNKERLVQSGNTLPLSGHKLGQRTIHAKIYKDQKEYTTSAPITIVSSVRPKLYTYKVVETYPHDIRGYTQGLEFHQDTLYESTGQYGSSSLRKTDYKTGKVLQEVSLPKKYFGEGLTIINDKIYQLTWRENIGFIYNLDTMEQTGTFVYGKSREGWGLCNDGQNIYKSDGTDRIWILDSNTLGEKDYIEIFTNTSKIKSVNELEWVDGKIYANVYQQSSIAIIDPSNGAVEGVIDLTDLKDKVTQHSKLDVLNGIAYKGEPNMLYITGKNWDKLFKIEIIEK